MEQHGDKCIYDLAEDVSIKISIIEYYPRLFREIRKKVGVTEDFLFKSFIPQHNIQAIHNFFTGTGKSSSFFFFSDNKTFVLKTLKDSEKNLLLDLGVLQQYHKYMTNSGDSLLSKYLGVYTIKI